MALQDIDTFVILVLENRSFDHMLGHLSLTGTLPVDGLRNDPAWLDQHANLFGADAPYQPKPFVQPAGSWDDPPHDADSVNTQITKLNKGGGPMGGFVQAYADAYKGTAAGPPADKTPVMGYQRAADVPAFEFLATQFAVCDRWFSPLPSSTQPNRLMAFAGEAKVYDTKSRLLVEQPLVYNWLGDRNIDWQVYTSGNYLPFFTIMLNWSLPIFSSLVLKLGGGGRRFKRLEADFETDWRAGGDKPAVLFVEPEYPSNKGAPNDDHPPTAIARGQQLVLEVYRTLLTHPARWARTMLIVTYDEHGGFFDHAAPLKIKDTAGDDNMHMAFSNTGPRVPALVVSPQVRAGSVFSQDLDHTAMLQMLADRFDGGAPYSPRVKARFDQVDGVRRLGRLADVLTVAPSATPRAPAAPAPVHEALAMAAAAPTPAPTQPRRPDELSLAFEAAIEHIEATRGPGEMPEEWRALLERKAAR